METQELKELIRKYNAGLASVSEKARIEEWYEQINGKDIELGNKSEKEKVKQEISAGLNHYLSNQEEENEEEHHPEQNRSIYSWLKWAAAFVLLALGTGLYVNLNNPKPKIVASIKSEPNVEDIAPGGNKATLTLTDGSKLILDKANNGVLINQGNTVISKTADGKLVYEVLNNQLSPSNTELNSIVTPRGGEYQVTLSDGTKVWLNAASSLSYPTVFSGKQRRVELKGEAYFEVAENAKKPFLLKVNDDIHIEVLGTHFNVMAYHDEAEVKATLLEGSIKVSKNSSSSLLEPGQQAIIGKGNLIKLANVNTEEAVAWKNGYFMFNDEPLESIMRKISKWYAVDIVYENMPDNLHFGGMVSRSKNISSVLKIMELTKNVHFEILPNDSSGTERRVLVMP